jgi:hypothetical protein
MPPDMLPPSIADRPDDTVEAGINPPAGKHRRRTSDWRRINSRARVVGSVVGYYYSQAHKVAPASPKTTIANLTPEEIAKLNEVGTNLGGTGQTLNIGANTLLRGTVNVGSDLSVAGHISANGPTTLSQLNITGAAVATSLAASSNVSVAGNTTLQQSLSVAGLATFTGGINVGGSASVNALNAASIAVRNIAISGPLTIAHLVTQGPAPTLVTGTAVGSGGTASISGNDTAGTLNFNTGSTPPAGVLATITFRAPFTAGVHVLLSPITAAAASTPVYVTRTSGGFQVHTAGTPPAGSSLSFDYFVTQ